MRYPDAGTGCSLKFGVSGSRDAVQRASSAAAAELIPWVLGTQQGVDDRPGRGVRGPFTPRLGQLMTVRLQVLGFGRRAIDGLIPSVDQNIASLSDFADHHVQPIDVVVSNQILKIIPHGGCRGEHEIRVRGDLGRIDHAVQVTANVHEPACRVTVPIRFDGSSQISAPDRYMGDMRAKLQDQLADLLGDRLESLKRIIAADDRRLERYVSLLQAFHHEAAKQSSGLVADQEHQSLVFVGSDLHSGIVDRKELESKGLCSIRGGGTSWSGSGTVIA